MPKEEILTLEYHPPRQRAVPSLKIRFQQMCKSHEKQKNCDPSVLLVVYDKKSKCPKLMVKLASTGIGKQSFAERSEEFPFLDIASLASGSTQNFS